MSAPELLLRTKKAKTKRGQRVLAKREPKVVEDVKAALLLHGNKSSQITKDVLTDFRKMKPETVRFTRKNDDVRPFEVGGETSLEFFATKSDCGLFALATHSKKRPHNLTLGRMYDGRLYDLLEVGVDSYTGIKEMGHAAVTVQAGNKPCFAFMGEKFETEPAFQLAKNVLLDFFRGRQVDNINLKGLDHVIFVAAVNQSLQIRQYAIRLKRSGTKVPIAELSEMGPALTLAMRRHRIAPPDVEREATKKPKLQKKKEKNVSQSMLEGKVGRIYMPRQELGTVALRKMKGLKRERQQAAAASTGQAAQKKQRPATEAGGDS